MGVKTIFLVKFELSASPGAESQKNTQKWPLLKNPKNSPELRIANKVNFGKQKKPAFLILIKVPEIDFELDWALNKLQLENRPKIEKTRLKWVEKP